MQTLCYWVIDTLQDLESDEVPSICLALDNFILTPNEEVIPAVQSHLPVLLSHEQQVTIDTLPYFVSEAEPSPHYTNSSTHRPLAHHFTAASSYYKPFQSITMSYDSRLRHRPFRCSRNFLLLHYSIHILHILKNASCLSIANAISTEVLLRLLRLWMSWFNRLWEGIRPEQSITFSA